MPLLLPACRFFSLPEPEQPGTEQQEVFPDTPEKVLENVEKALDTYYNSLTYSAALSYDFVFYPDDALPYPSNQPWDKETEGDIVSRLLLNLDFGTSRPSEVSFSILNRITYPDSAVLLVGYSMSFVFRNIGGKEAEGRAEMHMRRRPDGRWVITKWYDMKDSTFTWGETKLLFK
ncbi:MAG: hypothetical protein GXO39_04515 [Thermotogae bacterium]|nr:hypothetical protein [Thermotogota bacterium]